MSFLLHGVTLTLAWFLVVNAGASLAAAWIARRRLARDASGAPGFWLALRLLPAIASALFVAALFLPSYWEYEPREFVEGFDVTLTSLAAVALVVVVACGARAVLAWRRASQRTAGWLREAAPIALGSDGLDAFVVDAPVPLMALAGTVRPRLFVARGRLEALTPEERAASVAHELAHWRALDNLKRLAMHAAPDLLMLTPIARAIERRWVCASERSADRGAGADGKTRCALASALVKAARLAPAALPAAEPICTLIGGDEIARRVERLLDDSAAEPVAAPRRALWLCAAAAIATATATAAVVSYAPLLHAVHDATEILVNSLP